MIRSLVATAAVVGIRAEVLMLAFSAGVIVGYLVMAATAIATTVAPAFAGLVSSIARAAL
jgi:hypothetical protein